MKSWVFLATAALVLGSAASAGAQERQPTPELLTNVFECRAITDPAQRLACYDAAVGGLQQAEATGQVVAVDTAQVRQIEREGFGFNLPSLRRLLPSLASAPDAEAAALASQDFEIASVRERGYQRYVFEMANGQVWASVESIQPTNVRHFRRGAHVTIRSAAIGSFLMTAEHGPAHRVSRER